MAQNRSEKQTCHPNVYSSKNAPSAPISTLYAFLPTVVQSRIPIIASIRRSVRMPTIRPAKEAQPRSPRTPEQSRFTEVGDTYCGPDDEIVTREQLWQIAKRRRSQSRPASPDTVPSTSTADGAQTPQHAVEPAMMPYAAETRSGIDWNTAIPGIMLLNNARFILSRQTEPDPSILRSLHVDGLNYLLRALPSDLTARELEAINDALPLELRTAAADNRAMGPYTNNSKQKQQQNQSDQNILRRSVTYTIVQMALFFSFLLPILTVALNRCCRYERQHQITERVLTNGIGVAENMGERGLDLKDALIKFGNSRAGGAVWHAGAWVVDGVVGGVSDGVGKGMVVVGQAVMAQSSANAPPEEEGKEPRRIE